MTPDKPSWWQMFEPIHFDERKEHSLIGEIEPKRETAREKADRLWKMERFRECASHITTWR